MTKKRNNTEVNRPATNAIVPVSSLDYGRLVSEISDLLERARRTAARSVNSVLTVTYWEIGRRIVEYEQKGKSRAAYGEELLARLSEDLRAKHGRGFSERNLRQMRAFYSGWEIWQTPSAKFEARVRLSEAAAKELEKRQTSSAESAPSLAPVYLTVQTGMALTDIFPLS